MDRFTLDLQFIHFAGFEELNLEFERRDARMKSPFFEVVLDLRDSKACLGMDAKRNSHHYLQLRLFLLFP